MLVRVDIRIPLRHAFPRWVQWGGAMKKILFSLSLAIVILSASSPALAHSEATPHGVIISTGSEKDLYYKIGQGLLREPRVA